MSISIDIEVCCICLDEIDVFTTLSCCKNKIHKKCILEILKKDGDCPLCRHEFSEEDIEEILSDDILIDELYNYISSKETEQPTPESDDVRVSFKILSCCTVSLILLVSTSTIMSIAIFLTKNRDQ